MVAQVQEAGPSNSRVFNLCCEISSNKWLSFRLKHEIVFNEDTSYIYYEKGRELGLVKAMSGKKSQQPMTLSSILLVSSTSIFLLLHDRD